MKYAGIFFAIIVALFFRLFLVSVYKVPSQSMAPLILSGDYVLASQISYAFKSPISNTVYFSHPPQRGELVVYTSKAKIFIKRVLAVSSESVEYLNSELIINDLKCSYSEINELTKATVQGFTEQCMTSNFKVLKPVDQASYSQNLPKTVLLPNQYLVGGDNRSYENNPNALEIINSDQIVGKPLLVWMSYSSTQDFISQTLGVRWNRILTILN